ncbi:MAG: hypothetical protein JNK67_15940 [Alphaproteobacteria bacterium]|nr:hypothetical protein [Alphaproteobacteria bacterium]
MCAAAPAEAVIVRATVNILASGIEAVGGTIIAVGPAAPIVDFSGTDVTGLGGGNPFDQTSFMTNDCTTGTSICDQVRIRIGGVIDIDTSPGFAVVAPKIEPQDVATFIFSAPGTLELRLDTEVVFWDEDPLSPLAGAGISRYSFGAWQVTGTDGFTFGPTRDDASGDIAIGQILSFDLAPGTYRLFSPAVSVFLCAESPADGFCRETPVPAPASLAVFVAAILGLLGLRGGSRALAIAACAMLAAVLAIPPAQAALFQFRILFDEGPLAGTDHVGSFQTGSDAQPGIYYPDQADPARRLLTFDVNIAGASFDMFDDVLPGQNPTVRLSSNLAELTSQGVDFHTADVAIPYLFIWLYDGDVDFNIVEFRAGASDGLSRGSIVSITQGIDDIAIPPHTPEAERFVDLLGPDGLRARFPLAVDEPAVPAPATPFLLGAGLWMLAGVRRSRPLARDDRGRYRAMVERATGFRQWRIRASFRDCRHAIAALVLGLGAAGSAHGASIHLANIVPVATGVNDFELAPAILVNTWAQDGIRVTQVAGSGVIWLASGLGNGTRSWYPDSGDDGWTRITLDSGNNFDAVSFFGGSGWLAPPQTMYVELADDGVVVLSSTLDATFAGSWFGFAGGDFDEVRIRASQGMITGLLDCPSGGPGGDSGCNLAWLDDLRVGAAVITTPVSLPSTLGLLVLALALTKRSRG